MKIKVSKDGKVKQVEKEAKQVIDQAQRCANRGVTSFKYTVEEPTFGMDIIRKVESDTEGTVVCCERGNHSMSDGYIKFAIV